MTPSFEECRDRLIATVGSLVTESGNLTGFDATSWTDNWLTEFVPALGSTPRDYILTGHGCDFLVDLLQRMRSGGFS